MSNPPTPPRRRRIAGEPAPTVAPQSRKPLKKKVAKPASPAERDTKASPKGEGPAAASAAQAPKDTKVGSKLPPSYAWRWLAPLIVVTVAALIFGSVVGIPGLLQAKCQRAEANPSPSPAAKAGEAAKSIFGFRYDKLDENRADAKKLMTPKFQKEFDKVAPALASLAPQRKIYVQAETRAAATLQPGSKCTPNKANVLVFSDQARVSEDEKKPVVFTNRIVMHMVKSKGNWLVDGIDAL